MKNPDDAAVREELAETCRRLGQTDLAGIWSRAAQASRESRQLRRP